MQDNDTAGGHYFFRNLMYYVLILISIILFMSVVAWRDANASSKRKAIRLERKED